MSDTSMPFGPDPYEVLGKTTCITPRLGMSVQIPYDVKLERKYRRNRIANIGLPVVSTANDSETN